MVVTFRVCVSVFTGDNLFLNSILGFAESFSANFPCRHCVLPKADFQTTFRESPGIIRTRELHNEHVEVASVSQTGVKENSTLNCLDSFHSATNYVQDIMHDLFEGICTYDMRLFCRHIKTVDNSGVYVYCLKGIVCVIGLLRILWMPG